MSAADDRKSREDRLAEKLRENLRRRKAQARAQQPGDGESADGTLPKPAAGR